MGYDHISPKFDYSGDNLLYWAVSLSKAGYGSVDFLLGTRSDIFIYMVQYEQFVNEIRAEDYALNRQG